MRKRVPLLASVVAALFFITNTASLRALAADLQEYTLTPQQALGLYGTTIAADYYNGTGTETVTFQYIGSTSDLTALNGYPSGNGSQTYVDRYFLYDWYGIMNQARFGETPYLIYAWETDEVQTSASFDFSLRINHSVGITAYGYYTSALWSRSLGALFPGVNAGVSQYKSSYTLYGESLQDVLTTGAYFARPSLNSDYGIVSTMVRPVRVYNTAPNRLYYFGSSVSLGFMGQAAFVGSRQDGGDSVTVGASEIKMKMERPFDVPMGHNVSTDEYYDYAPSAVYILLQCPTLWGEYTLPPFNESGVDLSQIEEYLAQQGEDLANISEESTVQTRQLVAILAKLEQIYQAIQSSGFNPSLNPQAAQTLPPLEWSAQQTVIQEGTLSPQVIDEMTPAADVMTDSLTDILAASGMTLYAFGLVAICAAGWFLTRGRG